MAKAKAKKAAPKKAPKAKARPAAAKKPAKPKKPATPKRRVTPSRGIAVKAKPGKAVRGVELVERVIHQLAASDVSDPRPLTPAQIAELTMPNGRPLPPSLARFLAFDGPYLRVLEHDGTRLAFRSFLDMMREQFDDATAEQYADLARALPGQCLVVPGGSDSRRFMYVGEADEYGEYPVLVVDTDELPWVGLAYPGLDVYLADGTVVSLMKDTYLGAWSNKTYAPMLAEQARRNLHGLKALDYQEPEHIDGDEAAQAAMQKLLG